MTHLQCINFLHCAKVHCAACVAAAADCVAAWTGPRPGMTALVTVWAVLAAVAA